MMTTDKQGRPCRGFIAHVTGKDNHTVTYGTGKIGKPLCMEEAADLCRTALARGLAVVIETESEYTGKEQMTGGELLAMADWRHPDADADAAEELAYRKEQQRKELITTARGFIVFSTAKWRGAPRISREFVHYTPSTNLQMAAEHIQREQAAGNTVAARPIKKGASFTEVSPDEILDVYEPHLIDMRKVARRSAREVERGAARTAILEKANRRLIAPDIDTTGDFVDARMADNPLLAWVQ